MAAREVPPYLLLNWLQNGTDDMRLSALEQLCLDLLQYDNSELVIRIYPPVMYVPLLAHLCQDLGSSKHLMEAAVRSLTYYIQSVPQESVNRFLCINGSLSAICLRLNDPNMSIPIESDLCQQIIKMLEELCKRETRALSAIGGITYVLDFLSNHYKVIHYDTLKSGFFVLHKIIESINPVDLRLNHWVDFLSIFLRSTDSKIVDYSLHCLLSIMKVCNDKNVCTDQLGIESIIDNLLDMSLQQIKHDSSGNTDNNGETENVPPNNQATTNNIGLSRVVIDLILCTIRTSPLFLANMVNGNKLVNIMEQIVQYYDQASWSIIQLIEGIFDQIIEKVYCVRLHDLDEIEISPIDASLRVLQQAFGESNSTGINLRIARSKVNNEEMMHRYIKYHNCCLKIIIFRNVDHLKDLLMSIDFDPGYKDRYGQSMINWACAVGFHDAINALVARGISLNTGDKATSLQYAIIHGQTDVIELISQSQPMNVKIKDCEGRTITDCIEEQIAFEGENVEFFRDLLTIIESTPIQVPDGVIEAKTNFIIRMIPLLITIYWQNDKNSIRLHILELFNKIMKSFTDQDHEIFLETSFDDAPLHFHLSKLICRVLLQDTGENKLEALKICKTITTHHANTHHYIVSLQRMKIMNLLKPMSKKFAVTNSLVEELNIYYEIPLTINGKTPSGFTPIEDATESNLIVGQIYYWGDWNMILADAIYIYNDHFFIQFPIQNATDSFQISILFVQEIKSAKYEESKTYGFNQSQNNIVNLIAQMKQVVTEHQAITVVDKKIIYESEDAMYDILNKYEEVILDHNLISSPISIPKFITGQKVRYKNYYLAYTANHMKIEMVPEVDDSQDGEVNNVDPNDRVFAEISFNRIYGLHIRSYNQSIYKTNTISTKGWSYKLYAEKPLEFHDEERSHLLLNQIICHQIVEYNTDVMAILENDVTSSHSIINLEEQMRICNNAINIDYSLETKIIDGLSTIFSCHSNMPTSMELVECGFVEQFKLFLEKHGERVGFELKDILQNMSTFLLQSFELLENLPTTYQYHSLIGDNYLSRPLKMKVVFSNCEDQPSDFATNGHLIDPIPDLSNYKFLVMPLVKPKEVVKKFTNLLQILPWSRAAKSNFNTIRHLKNRHPNSIEIPFKLDYSENSANKSEGTLNEFYAKDICCAGLFHWLGTNGFRKVKFVNPNKLDLVSISSSNCHTSTSFSSIPTNMNCVINPISKHKLTSKLLSNSVNNQNYLNLRQIPSNQHRSQQSLVKSDYAIVKGGYKPNITIILKQPVTIKPSYYCLGRPEDDVMNDTRFILTSWKLLASNDGAHWIELSCHENDTRLLASKSCWYTWPIGYSRCENQEETDDDTFGWTMFRIQIEPENLDLLFLNGHTDAVSNDTEQNKYSANAILNFLAQRSKRFSKPAKPLEFYLSSFELFGSVWYNPPSRIEEIKKQSLEYVSKFKIGAHVKPGPDWCNSNPSFFNNGRVISTLKNGSVLVDWTVYDIENTKNIDDTIQFGNIENLPNIDKNSKNSDGYHRQIRHKMKPWNEEDGGIFELELDESKDIMEPFTEFVDTDDDQIPNDAVEKPTFELKLNKEGRNHPERIASHETFIKTCCSSSGMKGCESNISLNSNDISLETSNTDSRSLFAVPNVSDSIPNEQSRRLDTDNHEGNNTESNVQLPTSQAGMATNITLNDAEVNLDNQNEEVQGNSCGNKGGNKKTTFILRQKKKPSNQSINLPGQNQTATSDDQEKNSKSTKRLRRKMPRNFSEILSDNRRNNRVNRRAGSSELIDVSENIENEDASQSQTSRSMTERRHVRQSSSNTRRIASNTSDSFIVRSSQQVRSQAYSPTNEISICESSNMCDGNCEIHNSQANISPIFIEHKFQGLVQSVDHKSSNDSIFVASNRMKSNVEEFDYEKRSQQQELKSSDDSTSSCPQQTKYFGYDFDRHFSMCLEIRKVKRESTYYTSYHVSSANKPQVSVDNSVSNDLENNGVYFYNLRSENQYSMAESLLNILPNEDPILNIFPMESISDVWHYELILHYGFCRKCDSSDKKSCSTGQYCFYKESLPKEDNNITKANGTLANLLDTLKLLKSLQERYIGHPLNSALSYTNQTKLNASGSFISQSICRKTINQLKDVWALLSRSKLPKWVVEWPLKYQFLYSYEIRLNLLQSYWFGLSRSIHWLQYSAENLHMSSPLSGVTNINANYRGNGVSSIVSDSRSSRRLGSGETSFSITSPYVHLGRLKKHIVKMPRPNSSIYLSEESIKKANQQNFWHHVSMLFTTHTERKEQLEVQFIDEEGTGLGPTLEFVSTVSLEFIRASQGMWLNCEVGNNAYYNNEDKITKYVFSKNGLFPAPYPANEIPPETIERFHLLGIFMAKCLLDGHHIDIPLSNSFLQLLTKPEQFYNYENYTDNRSQFDICVSQFAEIYPEIGAFMYKVVEYCDNKQELISTLVDKNPQSLCDLENQLSYLARKDVGADFENLCIDMQFQPISVVGEKYGYTKVVNLCDKYDWEDNDTYQPKGAEGLNKTENDPIVKTDSKTEKVEHVTNANAEKYLNRILAYAMNKGVRKQITAVRDGFNKVLPINCLNLFTNGSSFTSPDSKDNQPNVTELQQLLCGQQYIEWTETELSTYTYPTQGYNSQSKAYKMLLKVLIDMNQDERRLFVQFITGCLGLPPGGLKALRPLITVVRKAGPDCGPYPSVNTCMHYLKLPDYEDQSELRERLLEACKQVGFFLN